MSLIIPNTIKTRLIFVLNGFSLVEYVRACVCSCLCVCVCVVVFCCVLFCFVLYCALLEVDINVFVLIYIVLSRIKRIIWITKWNKNDK